MDKKIMIKMMLIQIMILKKKYSVIIKKWIYLKYLNIQVKKMKKLY